MKILNIETSTKVCSVAFSVDGHVAFEKTSFDGPSHAALMGVFVEEAIAAAACVPDAVAVSGGPGSYTGLRIGASLAKGLCVGWNVPLIAIPTLNILASEAIRQYADEAAPDALFCAMLDARRMEVYAAIYDATMHVVRRTQAEIIADDTYAEWLDRQPIYFFGNGAAKCRDMIQSPRAVFVDDIHPLASAMVPLAERAYEEKRFEDVAYFEPFYLKEFVATVPKNKVLGK